MYKFFTANSLFLSMPLMMMLMMATACSSTPEIPNKGADLNTLEAQANYITSKNVCKKMTGMNVRPIEKPFLLGAFDVRDGIAERVPATSYHELLALSHKNASPLVNTNSTPAISEKNSSEYPDGLYTTEERLSYLIGQAIAKSFGKSGIPVMPTSMALGLKDAQTKDAPTISAVEEKAILILIKEKVQQPDNDWAENRNHYYMAEEKQFFAANITQPDVISLNSGVQLLVLKKGNEKKPKPSDSVIVKYKGSLLDGTEFDSSYKRNAPDVFKLNAMIPGFIQALSQVTEGASLIMYIPASLAYGEKGNDGIPPYAAVIFEVELLSIKSGFF